MNLLDLPIDIFVSILNLYNIDDIFKISLLISLYEKKNNLKIYPEYFNIKRIDKVTLYDNSTYRLIDKCNSISNKIDICEIKQQKITVDYNYQYNIIGKKATLHTLFRERLYNREYKIYYDVKYLDISIVHIIDKIMIDEFFIFPNLTKIKFTIHNKNYLDLYTKIANNNKITDIKISYYLLFNNVNYDYLDLLAMKNIYIKFRTAVTDYTRRINEEKKIYDLCKKYRNIKLSIMFYDTDNVTDELKLFAHKLTYKLIYGNTYTNIKSFTKCSLIKFKYIFPCKLELPEHYIVISDCSELLIIYIELFTDNVCLYLDNVPKLSVIIVYTDINIVYGENVDSNNIFIHKINRINVLNFQ